MSTLTGESAPVRPRADRRSANRGAARGADLVFSGTLAPAARPRRSYSRPGCSTELGRIAALSQRVKASAARWSARSTGSRG